MKQYYFIKSTDEDNGMMTYDSTDKICCFVEWLQNDGWENDEIIGLVNGTNEKRICACSKKIPYKIKRVIYEVETPEFDKIKDVAFIRK